MKPTLYIIVPCYNESDVLPITAPMFSEKLISMISVGKISDESKILFVDDGSSDNTWEIITALAEKDSCFKGVSLSRNRGHQNALLAGLSEAKDACDITVTVDCDGQDDLDAINLMVDEYLNGCEVVYGVRKSRKNDTIFKRATAHGFYRLMNKLGAESVYNHADYRLMSSRVVNELLNFKEVNLFLRGMVPLVGFKSTAVYYERKERLGGKTKYPLKRMLTLALDGITSLSIKPIRLITLLGFIVAIISVIGIAWSVVSALTGQTVAGWASTVSIICFLGGVQLISLGIIGEYIGKIYLETKQRPRFIISKRTKDE